MLSNANYVNHQMVTFLIFFAVHWQPVDARINITSWSMWGVHFYMKWSLWHCNLISIKWLPILLMIQSDMYNYWQWQVKWFSNILHRSPDSYCSVYCKPYSSICFLSNLYESNSLPLSNDPMTGMVQGQGGFSLSNKSSAVISVGKILE